MECSVSQITYPSSVPNKQIQAYIYHQEDVESKAILQISHGMCEYFLRYDEFARFLAAKGFIVCGNDHLGHGNSVPTNQELGYFSSQNGYQHLVEDVHLLNVVMKSHFSDLPYFLLGHSMGSFIARAYLDQYADEIDGAIISGTSGGNSFLSIGLATAALIRRIKGPYYRSALLKKLSGLTYRYENPYNPEFDWLTRDTAIIDKFANDEKSNFTFTVAGYQDLFRLLQQVTNDGWGKQIPKQLPIYLFSGDQDPVGNHGKGVRKVYNHLLRIGMIDVVLKLYPEGRHEMLNEINRQDVYQDTLNWLNQHL